MSNTKRFQCGYQTATLRPCDMFPADNGEYVLACDYDRDLLLARQENERLRTALTALWNETKLSGNDNASDYGWPKVKAMVLAALETGAEHE